MRDRRPALAALFVLGCGSGASTPEPAPEPAPEVSHSTTAGTDPSTASSEACPPELVAPDGPLVPVPGELYYEQIYVGGLTLGEAAVVVGPDGSRVLLDVGNDAHDDDVMAALEQVAAALDAQGLGPVDPTLVDHVLITHLHADHVDGFDDLSSQLTLRGRLVHRGLVDLTLANDGAVDTLCDYASEHPGAELALCAAEQPVPCDAASRAGAYPAVACEEASLPLGDATLQVWASNGFLDGASMEAASGPFRDDDSNGENARSLVGVLSHGAFRLLFAGDLTGGGSDTDDVESYYAPGLAVRLGPLGVDVLHLGHHGRDTSSSGPWLDALLPSDSADRNAVIGISPAHLGSPHAEVIDAVLGAGRLGAGKAWATTVAPGGTRHDDLIAPGSGSVRVRTVQGGLGYAVQWVDRDGSVADTRVFPSVRACAE